MECNEKFLKQLLESPYRDAVAEAILERLSHGYSVSVSFDNGETIKLHECQDAVRLLAECFAWTPPQPVTYNVTPGTRPEKRAGR